MDFKILNLGGINFSKSASNLASRVNFQGKPDIINFSEVAKERCKILDDLVSVGFPKEKAQELIKEYYNTSDYNKLINGEYDEDFDETFTAHCVDREGNLTPAEAIVYLHYALDDYYIQHTDLDYANVITSSTGYDAKGYEVGSADFSPLEMAKYMNEGFDEVLSGMILKGKIDPKTAKEVKEYYNETHDNFSYSTNVQQAEYSALTLSKRLDKLRYWTSDKKDEEGKLITGLTRPLTKAEATSIVLDDYLRNDPKSLNNYIEMNKRFGESLYSMDLGELWDIDPDIYEARLKSVTKPKAKRTVSDLPELINCVKQTYPFLNPDFLDDIKALDNEKFFRRYPAAAIKFDAVLCDIYDRTLRQKNIQILNSASDELLNKMSSGDVDKKLHFATLSDLFKQKDLKEKIEQLEEYRLKSPEMFNNMTRESVMDYIVDSDFYTRSKETFADFKRTLSGDFSERKHTPAKILEFPKNEE